MTREQFEDAYTDYPINLVAQRDTGVSNLIDADNFIEVAEAPTGFMVIKRHVFQS
jgi:hypothetical protein